MLFILPFILFIIGLAFISLYFNTIHYYLEHNYNHFLNNQELCRFGDTIVRKPLTFLI